MIFSNVNIGFKKILKILSHLNVNINVNNNVIIFMQPGKESQSHVSA